MAVDILKILKRPLMTEKNTDHLQKNIYAFEVSRDAEKPEIAKAIEAAFRVKVLDVRTLNCRGRQRRMGRAGKIPYFKKALVQLAPGDKIKIFEGA